MLSGRGRLASKDDLAVDTAVLLLTIVTLIIVVYPLIFVLSASVSEPLSVVRGEVKLLPVGFTLEGYGRILEYKPAWRGYANTIVYTVCGTIVSLVATIPGAYVLSRREIRGYGFFTTYFAITMFFNAGLVPTYLAVQSYGMLDTMWPLILGGAVSMSHLIVVRTYFNTSIPKDLSEAAFIDGCSDFRLFFEIMLPLAKPVIAVIALYAAVAQWNSYFKPLIYLSDPTKYPLQVHLRNILIMGETTDFMGSDADELADMVRLRQLRESMKYGLIVVSALPMLCVYPFLQRFFMKGIMMGSVKG